MPTKKIADFPIGKKCLHPEHEPPTMRLFEPGIYEHICPKCGQKKTFTVFPTNMDDNYDDLHPDYIKGSIED